MVLIKIKSGSIIVKVIGDFDLVIAKEFREQVDKLLLDNLAQNLIIDASEISFIDSSGLGALLGRYKLLQQKDGRMSIFGVKSSVLRILDLSGILKIIPVFITEEMALNRREA